MKNEETVGLLGKSI